MRHFACGWCLDSPIDEIKSWGGKSIFLNCLYFESLENLEIVEINDDVMTRD